MITNPQELEATLSGPIPPGRLARVYGQDIARHGLWADALRLAAAGTAKGPAAHLAFHAGWALEFAYFADPAGFAPYTAQFLEDFPTVQNPSVHRHYTKILCDLLRRGAVQPTPAQAEVIAERCFDFLIDATVKIGVKMWAMDVLEMLVPRVEWIGEHLREVIEQQMEGGSPGMVSHGRKLLRRLK
ncbi:MAG: hypothetical protein LBU95_03985 [Rikenellaceae bacterium]|jgi:hypothetical protein|nr:hypothetical protein [Rikenellaceae bacterium]